jgi:hypothetical protein
LELKKPAAEHAAKLGRSHADIVDSRLKFAKSFHQLHKRTPGRVDTQGRPRRSSVKYSNSDISDAILPFIHSSSQQSAQALEDLLTNECTYLTQNDVVQAIAALPIDFKIQICWPRGQIDTAIVLKLNALPRVVGLSERKHIAHGIRVRVIPPGSDPSEFSITHTTTMTRAALLVRKLLLPNIGKENS